VDIGEDAGELGNGTVLMLVSPAAESSNNLLQPSDQGVRSDSGI